MIVQDQVLVGTVLGGSSLVKPPKGMNYYLSMRSQNKLAVIQDGRNARLFCQLVPSLVFWHLPSQSQCCADLTSCHNDLYVNKKRNVTVDLLDRLMIRDIGIAIWYLDSGGKTGRGKKNAYINTTKFGEDGTKEVWRYFNGVDMPCNINHDGTRLKVLFTVNGTEQLFKTIASCFPTFMLNRL